MRGAGPVTIILQLFGFSPHALTYVTSSNSQKHPVTSIHAKTCIANYRSGTIHIDKQNKDLNSTS